MALRCWFPCLLAVSNVKGIFSVSPDESHCAARDDRGTCRQPEDPEELVALQAKIDKFPHWGWWGRFHRGRGYYKVATTTEAPVQPFWISAAVDTPCNKACGEFNDGLDVFRQISTVAAPFTLKAWDEVGERTPALPAPLPAPKEPTIPIIASGQYEPGHSALVTRDTAPAAVELPDDKELEEPSAASPPPAPSALGDSMPTPLERRQMRQLAANSSSPSPREAVSEGTTPAGSTPTTCLAATERLRDRLKQRAAETLAC
eukprot:s5241_g1.t2